MLKINGVYIFLHFLAWSFFLLFPIHLIPKISFFIENNPVFLIIYTFTSIATICFFYLNYYLLIPKYLFQNKYIIFIISIISFIIISILLTRFIITLDFLNKISINSSQPRLLANLLFRFLIVFIVAFTLRFYHKIKEFELNLIRTELTQLKAQINPHFLFNTLNGIYALALTKSDRTVDYLAKLSSMMRYSLSEISTDKVPLENEILYLKNYIELQKIRFTEKTIVNFTLNGNVDSQLISPLLFINLIENAFKYGVSNEVETEINIHIKIKENLLKFQVKNDIINQNNRTISQKIGLKNVKRRLDLIYENNYMLKVNHSDKEFEVIVEINLV